MEDGVLFLIAAPVVATVSCAVQFHVLRDHGAVPIGEDPFTTQDCVTANFAIVLGLAISSTGYT